MARGRDYGITDLITGKKLSDYIDAGKYDHERARWIVNGTDKAEPS